MIVVGIVSPSGPPASTVMAIARRAAAGARTEIVGAVPADHGGDQRLIELAAAGVGHAAVQRTAAEPEAADLDLALRYLPDVRVIVLVGGGSGHVSTAAAAAAWSNAALVLVDGGSVPDTLPVAPLVLAPPARDPDEAFAGFVAALAVRLDAGLELGRAWDETIAGTAADRVQPGDVPAAGAATTAPD